jgi:O-methyltransferase
MKKTIRRMVNAFGYDIRRLQSAPGPATNPEDIAVRESMARIRQNTMVVTEGLVTLYEQAAYCESFGIPGDFVECGVWKGGSVGLMALANLKYGKSRRTIRLFDSFEGICEPDAAVDGERALREVKEYAIGGGSGGRLVSLDGFYDSMGGVGTQADCKNLLEGDLAYPANLIHYHAGWFQDVMPAVASQIAQIAILRIDSDWYSSTKTCLDRLLGKVVRGGFVIIDDYGTYDGCRKAVNECLDAYPVRPFLHRVSDEIRYWIAP